MTNNIVEADQPMATAAAVIEKKARQLVYDSRYEVKDELKGKKVDPVTLERMISQRISKSRAIPAVIARARQMVSKKSGVKEDYILEIQESATDNVASALYKVFVAGVEETIPDYLEELRSLDDVKYKIRVTDPKTGNSYVRYATREKITQLRSKGLKVEMTEHGEPREGERKRGEQTARVKAGKGLDPVGQEDKDIDNDGDHDKTDKYLLNRRKVRGNAIQRRMGGTPDGKDTRKTVSASYEPEGEVLGERFRRLPPGYTKVPPTADSPPTNSNDVKSPQHHPGRGGASLQSASYEPKGEVIDEAGGRQGGGTIRPPKPGKSPVETKPPTNRGAVRFGTVDENRKPKKGLVGNQHIINANKNGKIDTGDFEILRNEEFLTDGTTSVEGQNKKQITGNNVDNSSLIKVMPQDGSDPQTNGGIIKAGTELDGALLVEKAKSKSKAQRRFMAMVYSTKKGKKAMSPEVAAAAESMTKKEAKKFAKTKHKGLPEKVAEEMGERDTRADQTYHQVIKNKFRSLGDKNPILLIPPEELEKMYNTGMTSDMIKKKKMDDKMCEGLVTGTAKAINAVLKPVGQTPEEGKEAVQRLTRNIDVVAKPVKSAFKAVLSVGPEKNQKMLNKRRPTAAQADRMENVESDAQVVEQEDKERRGTDYRGRDYGTGKQNKTIPPEGVMQGGWLEREKLKKA